MTLWTAAGQNRLIGNHNHCCAGAGHIHFIMEHYGCVARYCFMTLLECGQSNMGTAGSCETRVFPGLVYNVVLSEFEKCQSTGTTFTVCGTTLVQTKDAQTTVPNSKITQIISNNMCVCESLAIKPTRWELCFARTCWHIEQHITIILPARRQRRGGGWGGEVSRGEDRVEKSREEERREGREQKRTGTKEAHSSLRLVMYWVSNNV